MSKQPTSRISCRGQNLVFGYGTFGHRAVDLLQRSLATDEELVVIDIQPQVDVPKGVRFVCAEGVDWLAGNLTPAANIRRIIPVLPVHFAAQWLTTMLRQNGWTPLPCPLTDDLLAKLPNPMRLTDSSAVTSHATFRCPPDCIEPDNICTHTRQPRPTPLYQLLDSLDCRDFTPLTVQSRQFAPGLGGYYPDDLWKLLSRAQRLANHNLLVGTACKCHGIVDGISLKI